MRHHFWLFTFLFYEQLKSKGGGLINDTETKALRFGLWTSGNMINIQSEPEKLIVFNTERYGNWSDWSECISKDCIEIRHRKCLDDSWKTPSASRIHTTRCLSKYYAEKRTCRNETQCSSYSEFVKVIVVTDFGFFLIASSPAWPALSASVINLNPIQDTSRTSCQNEIFEYLWKWVLSVVQINIFHRFLIVQLGA